MMRSYVYAVGPAIKMGKCKDEARMWLPRVMIGDVRHHNFVTLVATVLGRKETEIKLHRVRHSRDSGPWIDEIPTEFRDTIARLEVTDAEMVAARWHEKCNWGHYGHWVAPWEELVGLIVLQIRTIAQFAVSHGFSLYFSQDARHEW